MGNSHPPSRSSYGRLTTKPNEPFRQTELSQTFNFEESLWQETSATESVCCFNYKKTQKRKIIWESKFISNCNNSAQDFGWMAELIDIVSHNELPKLKYYREVQQLLRDKNNLAVQSQKQVTTTHDEVERFKKNLKKSVIISFNLGSKATELPTIKSNISNGRSTLQRGLKVTNFYNNNDKRSKQKSNHKSSKQMQRTLSNMSKVTVGEMMPTQNNISKEACVQLDIFIKFSSILERHLNDMSCVLGRIKKTFIETFQKIYKEPSQGAKQLDYVIESTQRFLELLRDAVMDYYNLQSFAPPNQGSNKFISNDDNILSTVTAILFRDHTFYNCIFNLITYQFKERQAEFNKILTYLKGSNPERFTIKDKFCLNWLTIKKYVNKLKQSDPESIVQNIQITDIVVEHPEPYKVCMNHLNEMARSRAPVNKLKSIMACSQGITQQIEKFYDMNGLRKQKWMLDADQILSIFCYLIVGAKVQHLHTHLFLLDNFSSSHQMISMTGYYLSVIRCAVQQLQIQFSDVLVPQQAVKLN